MIKEKDVTATNYTKATTCNTMYYESRIQKVNKFQEWKESYISNFFDLFDTIVKIITLNLIYPNTGTSYRIKKIEKNLKNKLTS